MNSRDAGVPSSAEKAWTKVMKRKGGREEFPGFHQPLMRDGKSFVELDLRDPESREGLNWKEDENPQSLSLSLG
jgi:hypothetical protein